MKKTLAALAVLGAFAGSAMAADVTVYGIVDVGVKSRMPRHCLRRSVSERRSVKPVNAVTNIHGKH